MLLLKKKKILRGVKMTFVELKLYNIVYCAMVVSALRSFE